MNTDFAEKRERRLAKRAVNHVMSCFVIVAILTVGLGLGCFFTKHSPVVSGIFGFFTFFFAVMTAMGGVDLFKIFRAVRKFRAGKTTFNEVKVVFKGTMTLKSDAAV